MKHLTLIENRRWNCTLDLPSTQHVTEEQSGILPPTTLFLSVNEGFCDPERIVMRNAAELLDILYGHGVTSPATLRFLLNQVGRTEQPKNPVPATPVP